MDTTGRVLEVVELIAPGHVASYGDVGRAAGVGARHVGRVMARHGHEVAWWRVTSRDGLLPPHLLPDAAAHWEEEGIALRPDGRGCLIARHRVAATDLATS